MNKFILVYKGGGVAATDAERKTVMAAWGKWFEGLGKAVTDPGAPFGASKAIAKDGSVKDVAASPATGYSILAASSLDEAMKLAKTCPLLKSGGDIEVYQAAEM